jgi:hypothetical protein
LPQVRGGFYVPGDEMRLDGEWLFLLKRPELGPIRMGGTVPVRGKVVGAVISRGADGWSITVHVAGAEQRGEAKVVAGDDARPV